MAAPAMDSDQRALRYFTFYTRRLERVPKEDMARELGFASPQTLYQALGQDGFPVCPVCGETPAGSERCKTPRRRRPGPHDGEVVKLPSAADAIPLFEGVIGCPLPRLSPAGSTSPLPTR